MKKSKKSAASAPVLELLNSPQIVKRSAPHFNYNLAFHVPSEAKPRDKEYVRRALARIARKFAARGFCPRFEKSDVSWFLPPPRN